MRRVLALLCVLAVCTSVPAARAAGFGSPQVVTPDGCAVGHFAVGGGIVRGFASCGADRVLYLERRGGSWHRLSSSYSGDVAAVADDGTAAFVLLVTSAGLQVARRTHGGQEFPARTIATGGFVGTGALVAKDGRWWAVWSRSATADAQPQLWQAGTLLSATQAQQITSSAIGNTGVQLGIGPAGRLILAWARASNETSVVRIGSTADGHWTSRQLSPSNVRAHEPGMTADAAGVAVAWAEGNCCSSVRLTRLRASAAPISRSWTGQTQGGPPAVGGTSTNPVLGLTRQVSGQPRQVVLRPRSDGWFVQDVTISATSYAEAIGITQVLSSNVGTTVLFSDSRQSDPDPAYATDASRLLSRSTS